jgi:hypothetical protein
MSKMEIANPYFDSFDRTTVQDYEDIFKFEDAQMTIFDFIEQEGSGT